MSVRIILSSNFIDVLIDAKAVMQKGFQKQISEIIFPMLTALAR